MERRLSTKLSTLAAAVGLTLSGAALAQSTPREQGDTTPQTQGQSRSSQTQQRQSQRENTQTTQSNTTQNQERHDRQAQQDRDSRSTSSQSQQARDRNQQASGMGIANLAKENRDLSTFVKAVEAAGLEDSLSAGTNYTIFAPTNEAFESMRGKDMDELMKPENRDELVSLLRAHIVADDVSPQMARNLEEAKTIDGGTVNLDTEDGKLQVGNASVVDPQGMEMGNLRVYAIDDVLSARQGPFAALRNDDQRDRNRNER